MNKHKSSILGIAVLFLLASCKKVDVQHEALPAVEETSKVSVNQWKNLSWNASKQEQFTVHYGKISDNTLSSAVAEDGLVLVYKKTGTTVTALPAEDKATGNFWYYQVSENTIMVNCDAYGANQAIDKNQSFNYFILSSEKIKELEAAGTSKADLLQLTYEQAAALLTS